MRIPGAGRALHRRAGGAVIPMGIIRDRRSIKTAGGKDIGKGDIKTEIAGRVKDGRRFFTGSFLVGVCRTGLRIAVTLEAEESKFEVFPLLRRKTKYPGYRRLPEEEKQAEQQRKMFLFGCRSHYRYLYHIPVPLTSRFSSLDFPGGW